MDRQRGYMKNALADSLRYLMTGKLFEKITIKMICDETGVIRATFYNHFEDKYDCLNFIIQNDLTGQGTGEMNEKNLPVSLMACLNVIEKNREFYRRAYTTVTGQNSFEEMLELNLRLFVSAYFKSHRREEFMPQYNNDLISMYYASCVFCAVKMLIFDQNGIHTAKDAGIMLRDLTTHTFLDFSKEPEEW